MGDHFGIKLSHNWDIMRMQNGIVDRTMSAGTATVESLNPLTSVLLEEKPGKDEASSRHIAHSNSLTPRKRGPLQILNHDHSSHLSRKLSIWLVLIVYMCIYIYTCYPLMSSLYHHIIMISPIISPIYPCDFWLYIYVYIASGNLTKIWKNIIFHR